MEDSGANAATGGAIVSALAWVSRGFAKPVLEEFQPTEEEMVANKKMVKKMTNKGKQGDKGKQNED